ncbi:MAG: hypothetical protein ABSB29_06845 [Nitrososphaerales archaeon]|jgi:hypothetical protein
MGAKVGVLQWGLATNALTQAAFARRQNYARRILRPLTNHHSCDWRKIHGVVFESDDWGLCGEGKDRSTHERLASLGYDMYSKAQRRSYTNTLETEEDLDRLYRTLMSFRDSIGRNPVFTANFVMTNPSFSQISASGFTRYHSVPITLGFPGTWALRNSVVQAWHRGIKNKLIVPEYHGFSHFNYPRWLEGLRKGDKKLLDFFKEEMFTTSEQNPTVSEYGVASVSGVEYDSFEQQYSSITKGMRIFKSVFSSYPKSTIPPNDILNSLSLLAFARAGIGLVQSERRKITSILGLNQPDPRTPIDALRRVLLQLTVITRMYRNVRLEIGEQEETSALELSSRVFALGSPAIVGTHRQNYVGGVDSKAVDQGVKRLEDFLAGLCEDPNLFFLTSSEASQLSSKGHSVEKFGDELLIRNYTKRDLTLLVAGSSRHQLKDLMQEHATGSTMGLLEGGTKVHVPAGRTVSITEEG